MNRPPLAIAAVLALAAAAGCAPQCTCPATTPGVIPAPPPAAAPNPTPQPLPPQPSPARPMPAQPMPAQPAVAPPPAPAAGSVRLLNEGPAVRRMRSVYPPALLAGGTRGDVLVEATLDADGRVQSVMDVEATNDQFRGPALTVAQELRFTAPPAAGTTVRVRLRFQSSGSRIQIVTP